MPTRKKTIGIRLTSEEHDRVVEIAEKHHLKPASWVRQVILNALDDVSAVAISARPRRRTKSNT